MSRILLSGVPILFVLQSATPTQAQVPAPEDRARIAEAVAAAPASVSAAAEVRDWGGNVLRVGTNDWVCFPSIPDAGGNNAMCLDEPWLAFVNAWQNREPVTTTRVGFGYMLCGDAPASNTDPHAEERTPDNEWIAHGIPHVMVIVPDRAALEGMPTEPHDGQPWVMWRDTPYAHIMVPMPMNPDCR